MENSVQSWKSNSLNWKNSYNGSINNIILISRLETQIAELEKPLELLNQQHSDLTNKIAELLASKLTKKLAELEKHWKLLNKKLYHLEL
ncbi:MAG: hypothetical protein B6247_29170 [Candidatus Parabeggiatoa sp. nov. 2]|nr:MAG: hypothetical protein B6247_29170 [Beggiatoa sp. 4572_84]